MKVWKFAKGLNDYFFGLTFDASEWKHFGEIESGYCSPYGPYMRYSYKTISILGVLFHFGKGEHNHDRYLIRNLK